MVAEFARIPSLRTISHQDLHALERPVGQGRHECLWPSFGLRRFTAAFFSLVRCEKQMRR
jgi:hypothetical protein